MMRRPLTTLTLVATCGLLLLGAALALADEVRTSRDAAATRGDAPSVQRSWPLTLSAAPDDMTLAEVSFPKSAHGQRISSSSLQVSVGALFGDDYLAAGAPRPAGVPRLLVLLVNRPSPLLDPVDVHVRLSARAALGQPLVRTLADPLTRNAAAHKPVLCNLVLHGSALSAAEINPLHSRGQSLAGFDAAGALAQAYDLICGLAHASSFEAAISQSPAPMSPSPPSPAPPSPSPAPPSPTPPPTPPEGKLPGEGCVAAPGYACPAAYRSVSRPIAVGG